ncbi:MAG TPA: hemolysin family protein [Desulfopila sp.]|nr:hemolysin family protein [Desulfopila sp.]
MVQVPSQDSHKRIEMMTDKDNDIPSETSEPPSSKGILQRVFELIRLSRMPDSKEALESEIHELLEEGEEQGLISSLEEKMISSIFDFRETRAVEIMTPAVEIVSLDVSTTIEEIIRTVIDEGFTRIPMYEENHDHIIGILHAKDLLKTCAASKEAEFDLADILKSADFVSENKPIVDLLKEFQKRKTHMSMVTDEFGTLRGLITLEDILEEIVGEIDDEYDIEEKDLEVISDDVIRVQAKIDIEEVEEQFDTTLPEGPYESVGGLLTHSLGRIGRTGDTLELGNLTFAIKSATRRNIKIVEISRLVAEQS